MNTPGALPRGLVIGLLLCALVGFGTCGAWGTFNGATLMFTVRNGWVFGLTTLIPGLIGLRIAWGTWKAIRTVRRGSRPASEATRNSGPD